MNSRKWFLVLLVAVAVLGFALLLTPVPPVQAKIESDIKKVNARFTPGESVDVAMAMKILVHDPPQMLNPPQEGPPLLLYPPSAEDLERLSGE